MGKMAHAEGGRGCPWISPRLAIPILSRARRLTTAYRQKSCSNYHRSHRCQRPAIHLHNICAHHISAIAVPEFVFWYSLVFDAEVAWSEIQGSRTRWRNEICEWGHG